MPVILDTSVTDNLSSVRIFFNSAPVIVILIPPKDFQYIILSKLRMMHPITSEQVSVYIQSVKYRYDINAYNNLIDDLNLSDSEPK